MEVSDKLIQKHELNREECIALLEQWEDPDLNEKLRAEALRLRRKIYGDDIFLRGLIEFTNICQRDCYYCGIRKSNPAPERYRMKKKEILECCAYGYSLGLRTFVLQGGEDGYYNDERLVEIVRAIKEAYPDCAVTLSVGERSFESYEMLREAGADRYLLRHETADEEHYRRLHPSDMSLQSRINCLYDLKSLGYQVGAGFMVGSPFQTNESLAEDLMFLQDLHPEMVGIGPFVPNSDTSFAEYPAGSVDLTLFLLSVIRILLPDVLLPATTALATVDPQSRVKAMLAGANVLMPNISPLECRDQYTLYDNMISAAEDAKQRIAELTEQMEAAGFHIVYERGDHRPDPASQKSEEETRAADEEAEAEIRAEEIAKQKKKKKKKKEKDKAKKKAKAKEKEALKQKEKEKKKKKKEKGKKETAKKTDKSKTIEKGKDKSKG